MNKSLTEEDLDALKSDTPLGKIGTPEDIAELLLFLASDKASFITGQDIGINGGLVI
jgi:3-oxoacyl-[acyl-carrier protein] reductase